jgi:putative membrane protein
MISITIFTVASLMIIYIINLPIHNVFGINAQEAVRGFIDHWYDNGYSLEEVLTKISKKAKIPVHVYAFKKNDKIKAIFIIPYFHIGPFGTIGGGGIINYISKKLKEKYNCPIFIFHGTVTHDFNPVNSKKKREIFDKISEIIEKQNYKKLKSNIYYINNDEIYLLGVDINDNFLFSVSYSPKPTDDVDLGIGFSVINLFKKYFKNSTYVDPHNCFEFGDNELDPGDARYYKLVDYLKDFKKKNKKSCEFGFSQIINKELLDLGYIGNNGVCVFVGEIHDKKFCYVLIDGNNMEKGLREKYINLVRDLGFDLVEILTSDNHSINNVRGVMNPVKDSIVLRSAIRDGIKKSLEDQESSLDVIFDEFLVELDVFGPKRENEIVSVVETTVKLLKVFGSMTFLSAFLFSITVLVFF